MVTSVSSILNAQNAKIDSLTNLLEQHQKEDTIRVNLLNETARELERIDYSKSLTFADEALKLLRSHPRTGEIFSVPKM